MVYRPNSLNKASVARRLKTLILQQDESISSFAQRSGLPQKLVYKYVSGEILPPMPKMIALARALDCSIDFLLGNEPPEENPDEGFEMTLINSRLFRSQWTWSQRLFLVFVILYCMPPAEEDRLRKNLRVPKEPPPGIGSAPLQPP